jgi:hypothetical protein
MRIKFLQLGGSGEETADIAKALIAALVVLGFCGEILPPD